MHVCLYVGALCVRACTEYEEKSLGSEIWIQNTCILNPDLAFSGDMTIGTCVSLLGLPK